MYVIPSHPTRELLFRSISVKTVTQVLQDLCLNQHFGTLINLF